MQTFNPETETRAGRSRGRCLVALAALGLALAVVAAGGAASTTKFSDPKGDNPGGLAADITTVTVTNDAAGVIRFRVDTPNVPSLRTDDALGIYLDTDRNKATGENASDFWIQVFGGNGSRPIRLARWTGSSWDDATPQTTFAGSFASGLSASVNRSELGNTKGFDFFVAAGYKGGNYDYAPNSATSSGRWTFIVGSGTQQADGDRDGVPDSKDKCLKTKGGRYDTNHNGCPGPYRQIGAPRISPPVTTSNGTTTFARVAVAGIPRGATVRVAVGSRHETLHAGKSSSVQSKLLSGKTFRRGAQFTLQVTERGMIGYWARAQVLTNPPWISTLRRQCSAATGSATPKACSKVDRGR